MGMTEEQFQQVCEAFLCDDNFAEGFEPATAPKPDRHRHAKRECTFEASVPENRPPSGRTRRRSNTKGRFGALRQAFARDNCDIFDTDAEEQKLEYTEVYKKFQELFDVKIEELLGAQGVSTDDFYSACKQAVKTGDSDREEFMKMLIAITDYDMFLTTMREEKLRKDRASA